MKVIVCLGLLFLLLIITYMLSFQENMVVDGYIESFRELHTEHSVINNKEKQLL